MKMLKDAIRQIILQRPQFAIPQQNYELKDKDYSYIFDFIKGNEKIMAKDGFHIKKLIKNKSILKRYYSNELPDELKYLALIMLGIEYLLYFAQFEDANEGKIIFDKKMREEINNLVTL